MAKTLALLAVCMIFASCDEKPDDAKVPGVVQNLVATAGDAEVALSWDAPTDNGGADVTGYEVTSDNWANTVEKTASQTSHTFNGLNNGTAYTFKVRAVNENGAGAETSATATPESGITDGALITVAWLNANDWTIGIPFKTTAYTCADMIVVPNGTTLTILPGVTITFTATGAGFDVKSGGTIKAIGLPVMLDANGAEIGVTSGRITLKGASETKGAWNCIYVNSTTDNQFAYVDFINGGSRTDFFNNPGVLNINNGKASISHCKISGSLCHGVSLWDNFNLVDFNNNIVEKIDQSPVWMRGSLKKLEVFDMTSDFTDNAKKYIEVNQAQYHSENAVISKTSVPYYFSSSCDYLHAELTINAGVTIYVGDGVNLSGNSTPGQGRVLVNGTATEKVTFTRLPGTSQYWGTLCLTGLKESEIKHAIFEYGGKNSNSGILMIRGSGGFASDATLNNVEIRNSYNYGINLGSGGCDYRVTATNVSVYDNASGCVFYETSTCTLPAGFSCSNTGGGDDPGGGDDDDLEDCEEGGSYNPATHFCFEGKLYAKCDGLEYDPKTQFCDARDNTLYKHVTIGTQVWMAQNSQYNVSGSAIYQDDPTSLPTHGRYYTWTQAQNACPTGWHLPTDAEWTVLAELVEWDATKLKSTSGWSGNMNGTDDYGFNGVPTGGNPGSNMEWYSADQYVNWWSATLESGSNNAYYFLLDYLWTDDRDLIKRATRTSQSFWMYNVRCLKD